MTRLLALTVPVLVLLLLMYAFAQWQRRTALVFPDRYPLGDWNPRLPVAHTDETFRTRDGVLLHGWLFRAAEANAPAMIWFHGNAGNITGRAEVAAEFARRGITTLVFDYRGFGRSEGTPTEQALYDDSVSAYDFMRRTAGETTSIALYGESLGGPYAAYVATKKRVSCIVLENSFPSLTAIGNSLYRPLPLGWFVAGALTTTRWLNRAGRPVLVAHGRRDEVIPFALGQQLYDGLKVEKELYVSATAGHSALAYDQGDRYVTAVVRFVFAHRGAT